MKKRGQVTLFIIIAVVIIAIVLLLYFFVLKTKNYSEIEMPSNVVSYLEAEVKLSSQRSIIASGLFGGIFPLENEYRLNNGTISYWYVYGETFIPNNTKIQDSINNFIEESLKQNILTSNLSFSGFETEIGEVKAETIINEDITIINVNFPIILKKGDQTSIAEKTFSNRFNIRLPHIFEIGKTVFRNYKEENLHPLDAENLELTIYYLNETTVFMLEDSSSQFNEINYTLLFASQ